MCNVYRITKKKCYFNGDWGGGGTVWVHSETFAGRGLLMAVVLTLNMGLNPVDSARNDRLSVLYLRSAFCEVRNNPYIYDAASEIVKTKGNL